MMSDLTREQAICLISARYFLADAEIAIMERKA